MFGVTGYNQQDIVKDGLVVWLDANDKTSYPGTGTIWRDLSKTYTSASLTNGPTFTSTDGGNIVFDGSDDLAQFPDISLSNLYQKSFSFEFLVYSDSSYTSSATYATYLSIHSGTNSQLDIGGLRSGLGADVCIYSSLGNIANFSTGFIPPAFGSYVSGSTVYTYPGKWSYVTYTLDYPNNKTSIFLSGNLYATSSATGTMLNQNNTFRLGASFYGDYLNGKYSFFRMYNKALTSNEVLQNYNATKPRIGL